MTNRTTEYCEETEGSSTEELIGEAQVHKSGHEHKSRPKIIWNRCLDFIKDNVTNQVYKTWFVPIEPLELKDSELTVSVPSQFYYEWIEEHYFELMRATVKKIIGEEAKLNYKIIFNHTNDAARSSVKLPGLKKKQPESQNHIPFEAVQLSNNNFITNLNPRYTFENLIAGESNQLACSAAIAVSNNPGKTKFNPLVIYGGPGLGKTHLIQAIGNQITESNPRLKVFYTTSDMFTNDFVNSIRDNKVSEFINFYRSIDVLMVDDIQFFGGKEATQNNFFHTFNVLYQSGKQIILTSDKAPKELTDVDDRLISRVQWGLSADVKSPDFEMRMAILSRKSSDEGITLTSDIIEYIARNVKSSVRELEGVLIGLIAKVTLDRKPMTLDLVKEVVHGASKKQKGEVTIKDIKNVVSEYYQIDIKTIESKSRKHEIALARQMCMFLAKKLTANSLKIIGANFGGRDHSTVLHSCTAIENYLVTDKRVKNSYELLYKQLKTE